jgi:hypothetical protein
MLHIQSTTIHNNNALLRYITKVFRSLITNNTHYKQAAFSVMNDTAQSINNNDAILNVIRLQVARHNCQQSTLRTDVQCS